MKKLLGFLTVLVGVLTPVSAQQDPTGQPGQVARTAWSNYPAESSIDLLRGIQWGVRAPSRNDELPFTNIPNNWGNYFGQIFRGYFVAPVTGEYRFWLSGDDEVRLFISDSSDKFSVREEIAFRNRGSFPETEFGALREQAAMPKSLKAGQKYYFELYHKELEGPDFVKLAWSYCGGGLFTNWALDPAAVATQSSTAYGGQASRAIDGNTNGRYASGTITHTWWEPAGPFWQVDLGEDRLIDRIEVFNRNLNGPAITRRLRNYQVSVLDAAGQELFSEIRHAAPGSHTRAAELFEIPGVVGQTVRIKMLEGGQLALAEVKVFGRSDTTQPCPDLAAVPCSALQNWSLHPDASASQSSTVEGGLAERAIDGNVDGRFRNGSVTHTNFEAGAYWQVDLGSLRHIDRVEVFNRDLDQPANVAEQLMNYQISILDATGSVVSSTDRHTAGTHTLATEFWETGGVVGQTVRIQVLGPEWGRLHLAEVRVLGRPDPTASDAVYQPMTLIPTGAIESYAGSANDQDEDQLPDDWELEHGFDPTIIQGGHFSLDADNDQDGLSNFLESRFRLDPNAFSGAPGHLIEERWATDEVFEVADLTSSDDFFGEPSERRATSAPFPLRGTSIIEPVRLRGKLIAPKTGTYHFWLSVRGAGQLFLSTDENKFNKRLIAELGGNIGTGHGVDINNPAHWDFFSSQLSEGIELNAGDTYFFEILSVMRRHATIRSHIHLAWAIPGEERVELPLSALVSYGGDDLDLDDDYLPDAWETQFGLNPSDNGLTDRSREGERGDFDSDGLTNHEEYLYGTNPADADTDDDGLSDSEELRTYGTDPSASDVTPETLVSTISPNSVSGLGDTWTETSTGVLTTAFRGGGSWTFDVPEDGFYFVQVKADLRGDLRAEEKVPVINKIDGFRVNRETITFRNDQPASFRLLTPFLKTGSHSFGLFVDNYVARRSLEILSIQIIAPGGIDADGNGVPDEIENTLDARSYLKSRSQFSHFSPAFIEGRSASLDFVDLTTINRSSSSNRVQRYNQSQWDGLLPKFQTRLDRYADRLQTAMRGGYGRMEGTQFPHQPAAGHHYWYAKLPLRRNEAIGLTTQFENFGTCGCQIIAWTPYNVFDGGTLVIPVGSDLLLGGWISAWDKKEVALTLDGNPIADIKGTESHVQHFDQSGSFIITATHENGTTASATIEVRDAFIQENIAIPENAIHNLPLPGMPASLELDGGDDIEVYHYGASPQNTGSFARLGTTHPGTQRLAARLNDGHNDILATKEITVIGHSDGLRNGNDIVIPQGGDLFLVRSTLLVTPLPPGVTVEVVIFAGGVTFPDGSTTKILTAADFDQAGVHILEFLMPADRLRAPCHYIRIFDANGTQIFQGN